MNLSGTTAEFPVTVNNRKHMQKMALGWGLTAVLCYNSVMPRFTEQVEAAVEALSSDPAQPMDENEFIDASRLVYDGIRDIRKAVLMIRVSTTYLNSFLLFHSLPPTPGELTRISCVESRQRKMFI